LGTTGGVVKTKWAGLSGGPGITQTAVICSGGTDEWDGTKVQAAVNAVRAFWNTSPNTLPNELTLTVDPTVDIHEIVIGGLVGSFTAASAPAVVTGTNSGAFSYATGAKIVYKTATIANGRKVRGAMFIVPCGSDVFDTSGNVSSTPRTGWITASNTMAASFVTGQLKHVVWRRPTTKTSNDGGIAEVTGYDVPTKGAILRGRRDG
jgi:hypothetical protein